MISDKAIDNMIRGARIYTKLNIDINEFPASDIYDALCELKKYRECELRPVTKFKNITLEEQLAKIQEEFNEARDAFYRCDTVNLVEELGDLQAACVTMLNGMHVDEKARMNLRKYINKKNEERGYFDESVADQNKHREVNELSKAAAPLIELMQRKYNPHHKIIVTLDSVVLFGEMGVEVKGVE